MRIGKFALLGPFSGGDREIILIFVPTHRQKKPIATNGHHQARRRRLLRRVSMARIYSANSPPFASP
jgi:hypothetical protein